MNNLVWKKIALGTAVTFGAFAVQTAPADAITTGFNLNEFTAVDGSTDPIEDDVVAPNSQKEISVDFFSEGDLGGDTLQELEYQITSDADGELSFNSSDLNVNGLFKDSSGNPVTPTVTTPTSTNVTVSYQGLDVGNIQGTLDKLTYDTGSLSVLTNDGAADVNFSVTQAETESGTIDETDFGDSNNIDLEGEVQPAAVPFNTQSWIGLALLGSWGTWKYWQRKRAQQA